MVPSKEEWYEALSKRHGKGFQKKISGTAIAICGLGGLGSGIALMLARAGIGKLILIDYDSVDITNLHRQQYKANQTGMLKTEALRENLKEIAPYTEVECICMKISEENFIEIEDIFNEVDIICEAFDDATAKALLVNKVFEIFPEKYLIAASGMAGLGNANDIKTRRITKHFYLCGDEESDVNEGMGLVSSRVMVCAAHQAHAALQIIKDEL